MAPPAMAKSGKRTDPITEPPSTGVRRTAPTTTRTPPAATTVPHCRRSAGSVPATGSPAGFVPSSSGVSAQRKTYAAMPAPPAIARPTKHHRTRVTDSPRWRATAALTPGVQPRPLDLTRGGRGGRGAGARVADAPAAAAAPAAPAVPAPPDGSNAPSDAPVGDVTWSAAGSWGVGTPPS